MVGESAMYSTVRRIYLNDMINDYGLDNALKVKWITQEEYDSIKAEKNPPVVEPTPEPEPEPEPTPEEGEGETEPDPEPPVDEEEPAEEEVKENE